MYEKILAACLFPSVTWWPMAEKERSFSLHVPCDQIQNACVCDGRGEFEQNNNQSPQQPSPC